jgi:hypothetical protein
MGAALLFFLLLLAFGVVSISGAYTREGVLEPGIRPDAAHQRRGRIVMAVSAALVLTMIWVGKLWWDSDDRAFQRFIYKPLQMTATLDADSRLRL